MDDSTNLEDHAYIPQFAVWARGNHDLLHRIPDAVTIVGSRAATTYGMEIATDFAATLTGAGTPVVTGGSFGVEVAAIRGVLGADGAPIVVLPCGIDQAYPHAHGPVFEAVVAAGGLLVSLVEPGSTPTRLRFRARGQWMGKNAARTLVVEAAIRSGALVTANAAIEHNKPVAVIPGPITSAASLGCHQLAASGDASLVYDRDSLLAFARHQ